MGLFPVGPRFRATEATGICSNIVCLPNRLIDMSRTRNLKLGLVARCQGDPVAVCSPETPPEAKSESHPNLTEFDNDASFSASVSSLGNSSPPPCFSGFSGHERVSRHTLGYKNSQAIPAAGAFKRRAGHAMKGGVLCFAPVRIVNATPQPGSRVRMRPPSVKTAAKSIGFVGVVAWRGNGWSTNRLVCSSRWLASWPPISFAKLLT